MSTAKRSAKLDIWDVLKNRSLEGVILPRALESLTFGHYFNQTMEEVTLPDGLLVLTLGWTFNQSLEGVALPSSLQSLEGVTFQRLFRG
jgi:hypothetical protein